MSCTTPNYIPKDDIWAIEKMVNYVFIESLQCSPHHCYRGSSDCGIFWSSSTLSRRSQSCRGTRGRGSKTEHVCQMQYITCVCLYQLILMCNTFKFIGLCMQLFIVIVCQQACNANSMQSTTIDLRLKNAFFDIQCINWWDIFIFMIVGFSRQVWTPKLSDCVKL